MHVEASFTVQESIWQWQGKGAWHFIRLDPATSAEITKISVRHGWNSVRVRVSLEEVSWDTSLFLEKEGTYLLPIKASIRKQKNLRIDDRPKLNISLA